MKKFLNRLWKLIRRLKKKTVYEYPPEEREKIMSARLRLALKRNDVFVSKDLVKSHFLSPIKGEKNFLSSMQKRQFEKKSKEKKMSCIRKDIDYFSEKYSLFKLFHGIWMSYLQINGCNEAQK